MKAKYEIKLKITTVHDIETIKDLKDNSEYAKDVATLICDEVTKAGGVAVYEIIESALDVR